MKRGGMKKAWPSNIREFILQVSLQCSSAISILVFRTLLHSRFAQFQNVSGFTVCFKDLARLFYRGQRLEYCLELAKIEFDFES